LLARSKLSHRDAFTPALGIGGLLLAPAAVTTAIASVRHGSTGFRPIVFAPRSCWESRRPGDGSGATGQLVDQIAVVEPLDKDPRVNVIADPLPQAFCAGYLRPGSTSPGERLSS
jgi:hypothetical protein